jgi:hypothetical protein
MVRIVANEGGAFLWPPYTKAEEEGIDRWLRGDLVSYMIGPRVRQRRRQETQEDPPEDIHPGRKQP